MNPSGPLLYEATRGDEAGLATRPHVGGIAFIPTKVLSGRRRNAGVNYGTNGHRCPQEGNTMLQPAPDRAPGADTAGALGRGSRRPLAGHILSGTALGHTRRWRSWGVHWKTAWPCIFYA